MNLIWLDSLFPAMPRNMESNTNRDEIHVIAYASFFSSIVWLVVLLHRHHYHQQWLLCFLPATSFVVLCKQSLLDPKLNRNIFFLAHNHLL